MNEPTILWVDDEIELLKPQILFLREKGYHVIEASNGVDAIEKCREEVLDIVFLDEQMPGMSGLETLTDIKSIQPSIPIVMITKSEEENLMEDAIGSQISDYLIKPVKPQQILLTLKKLLDNRRLISEKTTSSYQQEFQQIFSRISMGLNHEEWAEVFLCGRGRQADALEEGGSEGEVEAKAQGHADSGRAEAPVPADFLAQRSADEGA